MVASLGSAPGVRSEPIITDDKLCSPLQAEVRKLRTALSESEDRYTKLLEYVGTQERLVEVLLSEICPLRKLKERQEAQW